MNNKLHYLLDQFILLVGRRLEYRSLEAVRECEIVPKEWKSFCLPP